MPLRYAGWLVNREDREALLAAFPPAYARTVADHVTLKAPVPRGFPSPAATEGAVVGVADDGTGVQALVVEINGSTRRPDGSTFHVTWSLAEGRRAVESNHVLRERGWSPVKRHRLRLELREPF